MNIFNKIILKAKQDKLLFPEVMKKELMKLTNSNIKN